MNILVTGIGGNVGYGILRNLRKNYHDVEIVGVNVEFVSAGNHLCNKVYKVPYGIETEYIPKIKEICLENEIDLIIPSTDYESYILSQNKEVLPLVSISDSDVLNVFLDKYITYNYFKKLKLPFVESCLTSDFNDQWDEYIVKPREGRGSRGIQFNPKNVNKFDDTYIVQPFLKGPEFTSTFYRTRQGEVLGVITFERSLENGATNICEVTSKYNDQLMELISKLTENINVLGSCNIQFKVVNKEIVPFEVNCRISGTNSIRNEFGFKDVVYTVEDFLFNRKPKVGIIEAGSSVRITHDIIYKNQKLDDVSNIKDNFYLNN